MLDSIHSALATALTWLALALVVVSAFKILRSASLHGGLLSSSQDGQPEPERVVALVGTVMAAVAYVMACLGESGGPQHRALTPPEPWTIAVLGAGQLSYLVGKALRHKE
jgi:hypothetical protein